MSRPAQHVASHEGGDLDAQEILVGLALGKSEKSSESKVTLDVQSLHELGHRLAHVAGVSRPAEWPSSTPQLMMILDNLIDTCGKQLARQRQRNQRHLQILDKQVPIERFKTEFLKNISHELRTPLASIEGFAAALLRGMEKKEPRGSEEMPVETRKRFLNIISQEAKRLGELIENMLEMADIESCPRNSKRTLFSVHDVFLEAISNFRSRWGEDKAALVRLDLVPEPSGPAICADRDAVLEILRHLMDNAHKFSGGQEIIMGAEPIVLQKRDGMDKLTRMWVLDRGIGIPPAEQSQLFSKFYRIESATNSMPGAGLGLSIVWALVQQNGGSVSVTSDVGKGATFTVILPAEARKAEE